MALPTSGPIHMGALADNNDSASRQDLVMSTLANQFASGSLVGDVDGNSTANQTADRDALKASPFGLSEFRGSNILNASFDSVEPQLADGTDVTSNGYVDGESAQIEFVRNNTDLGPSFTVGVKATSNNAILASNTVNVGTDTGTLDIPFTAPTTAEADDKYYAFVSTGTFENATGATINHFTAIANGVTRIKNSGGSIVETVFVSSSGASISNPVVSTSVNTGTQVSKSITGKSAVINGDGGAIAATLVSESNSGNTTYSISNTPGILRFQTSHVGNPSKARNETTSQRDFEVKYAQQIVSLQASDTTVNVSAVDGSNNVTITCTSRGRSGTVTIGHDTNNTPSDKTFTSVDEAVSTVYVQEDISKNFTISSAGTYHPKAFHDGDSVAYVGSSITVAPQLSFSIPQSQTINVNQTQAFSVSSLVGNNKQVVISSEDSIGGATLNADGSATMTPGANNKVYTITFAGSADYSQTSSSVALLTVNPTVSVGVSPGSGTFRPTTDTHGDAIASSTHGITPTEFTFTPSVEGNNITSFSYSITDFSFTSGNSSTQGTVKGKYTSGGSKSSDLTVSGQDSTSGTTSFDQTITAVTKAFTGGALDGVLREGSDITLSGVSANFVQNMRVQRYNGSSFVNISAITSDISGAVTVADTAALERDTNSSREVRIIDTDSSDTIVRSLGNAAILGPLPVIDTFSAATGNLLGEIDLTIATTNASSATVNQGVGSVSVDSNVTDTGNSNNATIIYTLTATNSDGESVQDTATATTINPSLSLGNPSLTSWTFGDTGNFTITYSKNFDDAVDIQMGEGLDTGTGGNVYQSISVSAQSGTVTFDRNQMHGTTFGTIVDFRIGSSASGKVVNDNAATFSDFSAPGQASNNSSVGTSGTAININFNAGSNATDHRVHNLTSGTSIDVAMPGTSATFTGLSAGTTFTFRVDALRSKTTTPNGSSQTTTKTTTGATFQVATFTWDSFIVKGDSMSSTSGVGFSTNQEDAVLAGADEQKELFYRSDIHTPGSNTVRFYNAQDGSVWSGGTSGKFFQIENTHIGLIDNSGDMTAGNYIAVGQAIPKSPTSLTFSSNTNSSIEMTWTDNSGIEDGFKIYYADSNADSGDTLGATIPQNNTTGEVTSLTNHSAPTVNSFTATAASESQINISWNVSSVDTLNVKAGPSSGNYTSTLTTTSATSGTVSETGLSAGTQRFYQINLTKFGRTYSFAVYAYNGSTLCTSAATNNFSLAAQTTTSTTDATSTQPSVSWDSWSAGSYALDTFGNGQTDTAIANINLDYGSGTISSIIGGTTPTFATLAVALAKTSNPTSYGNTLTGGNVNNETIYARVKLTQSADRVGSGTATLKLRHASGGTNTDSNTRNINWSHDVGGFACLDNSVLLNTDDGLQHIDSLSKGDMILSHNFNTGKNELVEIWDILKVKHSHLRKVTFDDGTEIMLTSDHPMVSLDNKLYSINPKKTIKTYKVNSSKLTINTEIKTINGSSKVKSIELIEDSRDTYTINTINKNFYANGKLSDSAIRFEKNVKVSFV